MAYESCSESKGIFGVFKIPNTRMSLRQTAEVVCFVALLTSGFLCFLFGPVNSLQGQSFSTKQLVEGNSNALALIRQIEFVMSHETKNYLAGKFHSEGTASRYWARRGDEIRHKYEAGKTLNDKGLPLDLYDWYADKNSVRLLRNWDPKKPQPISPPMQGTVRATIESRTRAMIGGLDVPSYLLWAFMAPFGEESRSLKELIEESPSVTLVGRVDIAGNETWQLQVKAPGDFGKTAPKCIYEIFVEPASNFHVRRAIIRLEDFKGQDGKSEIVPFELTYDVKSFRDYGDGVFVPVEIETRASVEAIVPRLSITTTHVAELIVNQPLSTHAFDFRFPENALVIDTRTGLTPDSRKVSLWGPDNKPIKEITKQEDIPGIDKGQPPSGVKIGEVSTRRSQPMLLAYFVALALSLFFVAYWYFWRKKNHGTQI